MKFFIPTIIFIDTVMGSFIRRLCNPKSKRISSNPNNVITNPYKDIVSVTFNESYTGELFINFFKNNKKDIKKTYVITFNSVTMEPAYFPEILRRLKNLKIHRYTFNSCVLNTNLPITLLESVKDSESLNILKFNDTKIRDLDLEAICYILENGKTPLKQILLNGDIGTNIVEKIINTLNNNNTLEMLTIENKIATLDSDSYIFEVLKSNNNTLINFSYSTISENLKKIMIYELKISESGTVLNIYCPGLHINTYSSILNSIADNALSKIKEIRFDSNQDDFLSNKEDEIRIFDEAFEKIYKKGIIIPINGWLNPDQRRRMKNKINKETSNTLTEESNNEDLAQKNNDESLNQDKLKDEINISLHQDNLIEETKNSPAEEYNNILTEESNISLTQETDNSLTKEQSQDNLIEENSQDNLTEETKNSPIEESKNNPIEESNISLTEDNLVENNENNQ